jgi:hypothetical protein
MNNLEIKRVKVKCDNEGCDWEWTVKSSKEFRFLVNKKCPECNGPAILLHYRDLFIWYFMLSVIWLLNLLPIKSRGELGEVKIRVKDGQVSIKPEETKEED